MGTSTASGDPSHLAELSTYRGFWHQVAPRPHCDKVKPNGEDSLWTWSLHSWHQLQPSPRQIPLLPTMEGLCHGRQEVLRQEGRGWVNSEASNGLSSPRWLQRAQGQGRDEKRPSWGAQRAACDVRVPELECGAAQSAAVLTNVKSTCLQKGRAAWERRGLSACPSLLCLHKAGNFLF